MVLPSMLERTEIISFLLEHLGEFSDPKPVIMTAVSHAFKEHSPFAGFILTAMENKKMLGAVVVNQTGMKSYYPENFLVYFAIHKNYLGKEFEKELMQQTIELAKGDIALHVKARNPIKQLFEEAGFAVEYLDMRYIRKDKKSKPN